jgi:hypothetical protein
MMIAAAIALVTRMTRTTSAKALSYPADRKELGGRQYKVLLVIYGITKTLVATSPHGAAFLRPQKMRSPTPKCRGIDVLYLVYPI